MVTHNRLALTRRSLESLLEKTPPGFTLHVVDNASTDGTREYLEGLATNHANLHVFFMQRNMGVAVASNLGWGVAPSDYYLKLDNDILIEDSRWLQRLLDLAEANPEIGQIAHSCGNWLYERSRIKLSGGGLIDSCALCNGGCVLIPQKTHERLGFWSEDYGLYGFEDLEYSERAALAGMVVGYVPEGGFVRHLGYEPETRDKKLEETKSAGVAARSRGEKLFALNRFLFRQGIRPLKVERRYLPEISGGKVSFRSNPNVLPLLRLQEQLLEKFEYHVSSEGVSLDATTLKAFFESEENERGA